MRSRSIVAGTRPQAGRKVNNSKIPKCESEMSNGLNGNQLKKTENIHIDCGAKDAGMIFELV
jgi:hypothetical protein